QWYKDGGPVGGATAASLTLNPTAAANSGSYLLRATNGCGSVDSAAAAVGVDAAAPPELSQPVTLTKAGALTVVNWTLTGASSYTLWSDPAANGLFTTSVITVPGT